MKQNSKKYIVVLVVLAVCVVACESVKNLANNKMVGNLANQAGVDNNTLKQGQAGLSAGSDLATGIGAAISEMPLEDERVLGETVGVQLYATDGFGEPIRNRDLMLFMNTMANVIAQNSSRPDIPYHVAVIKSNEKNAYALPGGYIFLTSGLVLSLDNEAQLAVVMGHEIAHIAQKHTLNEMKNSKVMGSFFNAGATLTAAAFDSNFDVFSDLVKDMGKNIANHSFSKELELDADVEGVRYAYDTGYNPNAILGVLDKLQEKDSQVSGDHATTTDRRNRFQELLQNEFSGEDLSNTVTTTGRLQQVKQWILQGDTESW